MSLCFELNKEVAKFFLFNCRLLDLVVHPIPQPSQGLEFIQRSPTRSPLCLLSSSLPLSSQLKRPHQSASRPSELLLLETPPVVKVSVAYLLPWGISMFQVHREIKLFMAKLWIVKCFTFSFLRYCFSG